ncbi:DUF6600 domain-containing protein [Chelativorans sp. YIM 93263]|uniref:DUF6600 domain-containing protein n=1 Tax=Chelativorans sp. YIM 93263 TaxID=2906648 RepID=UPI0023782F2A|nr:DUF6600 domain-containing protein [Chelativorans sp. YIM 93263]
MKKLLVGVAAAAFISAPMAASNITLGSSAAYAQQAQVDISVFFDSLRDYGSWVSHPRHRYVWVPTDVDAGWGPYTNGRWVYTDQYGWYFVSDEPFAWAVYHYGRWAYASDIGWYWVPGTRWAPAWVSWRRGDDYIGWAPLPPEGDGFAVSVEVSTVEPPPGYWAFVPVNQFTASDLSVTIVERSEIPTIYERTEVLGPVVVENDVVVNNVVDIDFIEQNADEEITIVEVQEVDDPAQAAQADSPAAFVGELTAEEDAAPQEAIETADVEAPTEGQDIEGAEDGSDQTGDEAPAEAPTDESPADEAPAEESPEEEVTPDQAPAEDGTSDEAPAEEAPTEDAPADEQPADGTDQAPSDEQPADEAPAVDEAPAEGAPVEEEPTNGASTTEEAPAEEPGDGAEGEAPETGAPAEEPTAEEQPSDEVPAEEQPAEEAEEAPADGTPAEECPPEAENCP